MVGMADGQKVLSQVGTTRERPNCRKVIIQTGLRPHPSVKDWDGYAVNDAGQINLINGGMRTQMARMIAEGYWGESN